MTGNEIRDALDKARVLPSKQMGQNFLTDANIARWIVSQLEIKPEETVVEVGPGTGALTEHLLGVAKRVVLIEFDPRLSAALEERFRDRDDVEVYLADAAKFDRRLLFKHRPVKFLGNLPYSSGGAIMKNLLGRPHPFSRAVIMLQKEVIDRLGAQPGTKDYGLLSLRMQVNWHVKAGKIVPPEAFYPRPHIDSAVAVLVPRKPEEDPVFDARLFDELVRRGFAQRRKQMKKQMPDEPAWEEICEEVGLAPTVRGEQLDLRKWISVTRAYDRHPLKDEAQKGEEIFDVVDENDVVVRQETREKVHAEGLIHRAVHVFVFNKRGDLYLQKRSHLKDKNAGLWDSSVSGHLDTGEDYAEAAVRELEEEIGVSGVEMEKVLSVKPTEQTGWEHVRLYVAKHSGAVNFPAAEVESMMPFPVSEIGAWVESRPEDFSPTFRMMLEGYLGGGRSLD